MGSRAVVIVCRDEDAVHARFGIEGEGIGIVLTRTGRRFFDDPRVEQQLLAHVRDAAEAAGLFEELKTTWL
jgi:protein phosphatase